MCNITFGDKKIDRYSAFLFYLLLHSTLVANDCWFTPENGREMFKHTISSSIWLLENIQRPEGNIKKTAIHCAINSLVRTTGHILGKKYLPGNAGTFCARNLLSFFIFAFIEYQSDEMSAIYIDTPPSREKNAFAYGIVQSVLPEIIYQIEGKILDYLNLNGSSNPK